MLAVFGLLCFSAVSTVAGQTYERKNLLKVNKESQITFPELWNSTGFSVSNGSLFRDVLIDQIESNPPENIKVYFRDKNFANLWVMKFTTVGITTDIQSWMNIDNLQQLNNITNIKGNLSLVNEQETFSIRNNVQDERVYVYQGQIGTAFDQGTTSDNVILFTKDGNPYNIPMQLTSNSTKFLSNFDNDVGKDSLLIQVDSGNFVTGISISTFESANLNYTSYTICYHISFSCDNCTEIMGITGKTDGRQTLFDVIRPGCLRITFERAVQVAKYELFKTDSDLIPAHSLVVVGIYRVLGSRWTERNMSTSSTVTEQGQQTGSVTGTGTCCCPFTNMYGNMTDEQIMEKLKMDLLALQAKLTINKDILSKTVRTKTCASDNRTSSKIYGYFAWFIIGFILLLICISDFTKLAYRAFNQLHSRRTK